MRDTEQVTRSNGGSGGGGGKHRSDGERLTVVAGATASGGSLVLHFDERCWMERYGVF